MLPPGGAGAEMAGEVNDFTPEIRDFLLVVLLLTPLQAAAEEYAFRGYLLQAFGGLVRAPGVRRRALVAAVRPRPRHRAGPPDLLRPVRVRRSSPAPSSIITGGLEAGIAMHVLNNWLAFGAALAYGDMGSALNPTGGTWWSIPVDPHPVARLPRAWRGGWPG